MDNKARIIAKMSKNLLNIFYRVEEKLSNEYDVKTDFDVITNYNHYHDSFYIKYEDDKIKVRGALYVRRKYYNNSSPYIRSRLENYFVSLKEEKLILSLAGINHEK